MLVIVRWVLLFAPVGIFALVLPLSVKMGLGAVGALAYYVVLASALSVVVMLCLYPLVVSSGKRFTRSVLSGDDACTGSRFQFSIITCIAAGYD